MTQFLLQACHKVAARQSCASDNTRLFSYICAFTLFRYADIRVSFEIESIPTYAKDTTCFGISYSLVEG